MSTLLLIFAAYIALDRLLMIGKIGDSIEITRGFAVLSVITGTCMIALLVLAATGGVTP